MRENKARFDNAIENARLFASVACVVTAAPNPRIAAAYAARDRLPISPTKLASFCVPSGLLLPSVKDFCDDSSES